MKFVNKPLKFKLLVSGIILLLILALQPLFIFELGENIVMLFPKGWIAVEERNLLFIVQGLMLLVIIPVYILTFVFSWIYRADNPRGKYDPTIVDNVYAEIIWWGLPLIMTTIIAVLTWVETERLDPFKPISADKKQITIQVVALQWKWLFIYPEDKIASLNFVHIPEKTPILFEITADAPMNSFWIPSLGGQIYAMPSMKSQLNLIADTSGDFRGSSANISGEGFAGMHFITRSSSDEEYKKWIESVKQSSKALNKETYEKIALPSSNAPVEMYRLEDDTLFNHILMKYM